MGYFKSWRISRIHNLLFPDKIEIDGYKVTYYKGWIIGFSSTCIPRHNVASVKINQGLLFSDIIIESSGERKIFCEGLSKSDAKRIFALLQN